MLIIRIWKDNVVIFFLEEQSESSDDRSESSDDTSESSGDTFEPPNTSGSSDSDEWTIEPTEAFWRKETKSDVNL